MHLLDDNQRQLLIAALINKPGAAVDLLRRTGYKILEDEIALIAMLSGVDTKIWVEKP